MSADLLIESNDGQLFLVGAQAARQSALFKDLLVFTPADAAESVVVYPEENNNNNSTAESTTEKRKPSFTCKTVDGHTMALVLEWLEHHQDEDIEEKTVADDDGPFRERPLPEWDAAFFGRVGRGWAELAPLIEAASYLNIDRLVKYTAKAIADQMSGMSTEQMRAYAGIQVTEEEVAALEKWVDMDMSGDQLVDINSQNSDNGVE